MNATEYFRNLIEKNKLAREHEFEFKTASSLYDLQEVAYDMADHANFFVFVETTTGSTAQGRGGGYFEDKQYGAAILMRFETGNETDRMAVLNTMRELQRQILSRMIKDAYAFEEKDMQFFDTSRTISQEQSNFYFAGLAALWMQFSMEQPKNLKYESSDWDD